MRKRLVRILLFSAIGAGALALMALVIWARLPEVGWLAKKNPRSTALIEQRRAEARRAGRAFRPQQTWITLQQVSPRLIDAVVLSEDARFYAHGPFDWREMRNAAQESLEAGRFARGASTLTQQLAKNLFLGTEKTLTRKLREALLAVKIDRALPKRRVLGLYLNVAEWGDGIFGIEAAARAHFGVPAADLGTAQACILAAMLPQPRRTGPAHPTPRLMERSRTLLDRMRESGRIDADEHAQASAELERILAPPAELPAVPEANAPAAEPASDQDDDLDEDG